MENKPAPSFELLDQNNKTRNLSDYRGRWVVLYFYPRDNSLGCTKQACNFRDEYRIISQFGGAEVIGINKGSVESHKKFADRHHLNFPILSDVDHKITKAYGAWKLNLGVPHLLDKPFATRRNSYLINPDGVIVKSYIAVNPNRHADDIISDLQEFQKKTSRKAHPANS